MKAYIQLKSATGDRLATLDIPNLASFLVNSRNSIRMHLADAFGHMLKKPCYISFEDECVFCRKVVYDRCCDNHDCQDGFPAQADLARLMKELPFKTKETAEAYFNRLKTAWRAEIAGAEAASCLKNL